MNPWVKKTSKTYRPTAVHHDWKVFDDAFQKMRPDKTKCFKCGQAFFEGKLLNLVQIKGHVNVLCCGDCVKS